MLAALALLFRLLVALILNLHPAPAATVPTAGAAGGVDVLHTPAAPAPQIGKGAARVGPEGGRPHSGAATAAPPPVVAAPGPDSPVCEAGQTPAVDGCAQGQLDGETTGRQY